MREYRQIWKASSLAALNSLMVGRCAVAHGLGGPYQGGEVNTEHESTFILYIRYMYYILGSAAQLDDSVPPSPSPNAYGLGPYEWSGGSTRPGWHNESLDEDHANGSVTLHYVMLGPLRVS